MTTLEHYTMAKNTFLADLPTRTKSAATHKQYAMVLSEFEDWLAQSKYAEQSDSAITPLMIVDWKQWTLGRGVKSNTLLTYMIILRAFFKWCVKKGFYSEQPIDDDDLPKKEKVKLDLLTEQEISLILAGELPKWSHKSTALRNRAIIVLIMESGLRASELLTLRMCDLDFMNGTVEVVNGKGSKRRSTTLTRRAIQVIDEWLNSDTAQRNKPDTVPLFSSFDERTCEWKAFSRIYLHEMIQNYVYNLTGHAGIGTHDLRHSFASVLLTHGAKLDEIQKVLGHNNYGTTVIYAEHLCPKQIPQTLSGIFDKI